ncbi:MAG: hypothetical protein COA57_08480 [Flavobacteriales bacterium]|nr:MAG: hypothetical protein COA57_08480 [Flavobacteriales bacterium]
MNELYSGLKPKERIDKVIFDKVKPPLEELGFKYLKSEPSFKRSVNNFIQEISFSTSKWNETDEHVAFDLYIEVVSKEYDEWCKLNYPDQVNGNRIFGFRPQNLPEKSWKLPNWSHFWDNRFYNGWYNLAEHDNKDLIESLLNDLHTIAIPLMDAASEWSSAAKLLRAYQDWTVLPLIMDCYLIEDKIEDAKELLDWVQRQEIVAKWQNNRIIERFESRRDRIENWS